MLRRRTIPIVHTIALVALFSCAALPLRAQVHNLTLVTSDATPGTAVLVSVLLDNTEPVRGFSLGLTHDASIVSLDLIEQGDALLVSNGGVGPDFFFEDIAAPNGPGGTSGAVLSFAVPLDDIPIGPGSELVRYHYTVLPAALPGTSTSLDFVNTLGDPALETLVSVAGVSRIPVTVPGSIAVETAPVTGLTCALVDPCSCEFSLAWTNQGNYDNVDILQDGVVVQTLGGGATSALVSIIATTIGGPASSTLSVVPRQNAVDAIETACAAVCPDVPDPVEPSGFTCSVDPFTGLASLSWANSQNYPSIAVSVDGVPQSSLPGIVTSTSLTLPAPGVYSICLDGTDECGVSFTQVCCTAVYEQVFVRGDINADGGYNISDPISGLEHLFGGGPLLCSEALDANDSGGTDLADIVFALNGIFGIGGLPSAPFPACGVDPTGDLLTCASFPICP